MRVIESGQRLRSIVTRRTLLPPPANTADPEWARSWEHLFARYEPAMQRYVRGVLARAGGRAPDPEEVADTVRDYLAQSLEKGWLARDGEEIRSFRAYLQTQLRRFALKRLSRRQEGVALPEDPADADADDPAESDLDEGWVQVAVARALERLAGGNADYHAVIADLLATEGAGSSDLAARMGKRPEQLVHLRHRARRRFALLFHEELRGTVRDERAFEELCGRLEPYLP